MEKAQQNQVLVAKAKTFTIDVVNKGTKVGKNQLWKQKTGNDKTAWAMIQGIPASHMACQGTGSELKSDQQHLDMDLLLNAETYNKWLNPQQQVYLVTISKLPTAANFTIEIKECKTNHLFDMGPKYLAYSMNAIENLFWKKMIQNSKLKWAQQMDEIWDLLELSFTL